MNKDKARHQARWGAYVSFWACITTALMVVLSQAHMRTPIPLNYSAFVDAFLFLLIGIGIWRMSRAAAVAGLILHLTETAWKIDTFGYRRLSTVTWLWTGIFAVCFLVAVRGTFVFQRLSEQERISKQQPAVEDQKATAASAQ